MFQLFLVKILSVFLGLSVISCIRQYLSTTPRLTLAAVIALSSANSGQVFSFIQAISIFASCLLCSIPIAFGCEALSVSGRLVDVARGAQFSEQLIPGVGRVSILEGAGLFFSLLWILLIDFQLFVSIFMNSCEQLHFTNYTSTLVRLISLFSESFYAGIYVAAPLLAISFLLDTSGMLIAKLLDRFPITFELLPIRLLLILLCFAVRLYGEPTCLINLRARAGTILELV